MQKNTLWFNGLSMDDVDKVGGKNASLGEMVSNLANVGVSVPNGFATTSYAFNQFLDHEGLDELFTNYLMNWTLTMLKLCVRQALPSVNGYYKPLSLRILNKKFAIIMKNLSKATLSFR